MLYINELRIGFQVELRGVTVLIALWLGATWVIYGGE